MDELPLRFPRPGPVEWIGPSPGHRAARLVVDEVVARVGRGPRAEALA